MKQCKVWNAFQEDYNDDELQKNYDRFNEVELRARKEHNDLVPIYNSKVNELVFIEKNIFDLALIRIHNEELLSRRTRLIDEIEELKAKISDLNKIIDENKRLISKYNDLSIDRLFVWYKALKSVEHPEAKTYIDFKNKWGKKII